MWWLQALFRVASNDREEQVHLTARTASVTDGRLDEEQAASSSSTVSLVCKSIEGVHACVPVCVWVWKHLCMCMCVCVCMSRLNELCAGRHHPEGAAHTSQRSTRPCSQLGAGVYRNKRAMTAH